MSLEFLIFGTVPVSDADALDEDDEELELAEPDVLEFEDVVVDACAAFSPAIQAAHCQRSSIVFSPAIQAAHS